MFQNDNSYKLVFYESKIYNNRFIRNLPYIHIF